MADNLYMNINNVCYICSDPFGAKIINNHPMGTPQKTGVTFSDEIYENRLVNNKFIMEERTNMDKLSHRGPSTSKENSAEGQIVYKKRGMLKRADTLLNPLKNYINRKIDAHRKQSDASEVCFPLKLYKVLFI